MDPAIGPFRVLRSLALVAISGALVAACASSSTAGRSAVTTVRSTTTTSSTSVTAAATGAGDSGTTKKYIEVTDAWNAAQMAFHDAALTSDADYPALVATTVNPQLNRIQELFRRELAEGYVAKGPSIFGPARTTPLGSNQATVVSCLHGEEIEINSRTGEPAPGVLGEADYELVTSLMVLTSSGWKLSDQSVVVGGCDGE